MTITESILLRIALAVIAGGIIGAEREYRSKSAGFRTMTLISLGSCMFTIFSALINPTEPERIAVAVASGIGFLGAGVIFKSDNHVTGLTTAAAIWATASIGMGIGAGYYLYAGFATILALLVLVLLTRLESYIDRINQVRSYKIVCNYDEGKLKFYEKRFMHHRLRFKRGAQTRNENMLSGIWIVQGSEKNHEKFISEILQDDSVKEFEF